MLGLVRVGQRVSLRFRVEKIYRTYFILNVQYIFIRLNKTFCSCAQVARRSVNISAANASSVPDYVKSAAPTDVTKTSNGIRVASEVSYLI